MLGGSKQGREHLPWNHCWRPGLELLLWSTHVRPCSASASRQRKSPQGKGILKRVRRLWDLAGGKLGETEQTSEKGMPRVQENLPVLAALPHPFLGTREVVDFGEEANAPGCGRPRRPTRGLLHTQHRSGARWAQGDRPCSDFTFQQALERQSCPHGTSVKGFCPSWVGICWKWGRAGWPEAENKSGTRTGLNRGSSKLSLTGYPRGLAAPR